MTLLGADPDQLIAAAGRFRAAAEVHTQANAEIGYWLSKAQWHGDHAEHFRQQYHTRISPGLVSASSFLDSLCTDLKAQAEQQRNASNGSTLIYGPPQVVCGTPFIDSLWDAIVEELSDLYEFSSSVLVDTTRTLWRFADRTLDIENALNLGHYLVRHIRALRNIPFGRFVPYAVNQVDDLGLARVLGSTAGKIFVGAGGVIGAISLPGDIAETIDRGNELAEAFQSGDGARINEAIEQFAYSYSDIPIDVGAMVLTASLFSGPAAPVVAAVGVGLMTGGIVIKAGAFVFDHFREPVAEAISAVYDFTKDVGGAAVDFTKDVGGAAIDFAKDVGEEAVDFAKDVGGAAVDFAKDVGEGAVDFAKDVLGSPYNPIKGPIRALGFLD